MQALLSLLDPESDREDRWDGAMLLWFFIRDVHLLRNTFVSLKGGKTDIDP